MKSKLNEEEFYQLIKKESPRVLFRFASGGGFCAEMVKLVSVLVAALCRGYGFRMQICQPKGFGVENGWADYFDDRFLHEYLPFVGFLNDPAARFVSRTRITRLGTRWILQLFSKRPTPIFYRDFSTRLDRIDREVFGVGVDFWGAASQVLDIIWRPRPAVMARVKLSLDHISTMAAVYHAMHIRRGDKSTEMVLPELEKYISSANSELPLNSVLYICGDDLEAITEVVAKIRSDVRTVVSRNCRPSGYNQLEFNRLSMEMRREQTIGMFEDLEFLFGAASVIGSLNSNVLGLVKMRRPSTRFIEVQSD